MRIEVNRQEGYELLHRGAVALAEVEANGIRVDVDKLARTKAKLLKEIRKIRDKIEGSAEWKIWRRRFGSKANMQSRDQLAVIVYKELGHKVQHWTESGKPAADEESLQYINLPFVRLLIRLLKYEKTLSTFLKGIEREVVGDRLHPIFSLDTVRSYRSSSEAPNFQNFPVRDKEMSKIVRSLFIPSPNSVLVENDFKGLEVSISACYHRDRNFISYIASPGKDMHRDMAAQLYMIEPEEVSKDARYGAKNKFVFPQFYGDFYAPCARALWEWIEQGKLITPDGTSLFNHLRRHGIKECGDCDPEQEPRKGTFERHVKQVEDDFWNNRFRDYGKWRKRWYGNYLERGYFDLYTGFRVYGIFSRNAVVNYPIQGSAFHCLLWTLIRVNRLLHKYRMRSKLVGQIHDSLVGDVKIKELCDYSEIVWRVTTVELRKHWPWIIVPLGIEYEICPEHGNWFQKREVKFSKGAIVLPEKEE